MAKDFISMESSKVATGSNGSDNFSGASNDGKRRRGRPKTVPRAHSVESPSVKQEYYDNDYSSSGISQESESAYTGRINN